MSYDSDNHTSQNTWYGCLQYSTYWNLCRLWLWLWPNPIIIIYIFYNFSLKFPISLNSNSYNKMFRTYGISQRFEIRTHSHTIDEMPEASENELPVGLRWVFIWERRRHEPRHRPCTQRLPAKISFLFFSVINESNQIDIYPAFALRLLRISDAGRTVGWCFAFFQITYFHFSAIASAAFFSARLVNVGRTHMWLSFYGSSFSLFDTIALGHKECRFD